MKAKAMMAAEPGQMEFKEFLADSAQAGNMEDSVRIINSREYPIERISNFTYRLEELPRALDETAHPPEGFIKGAVVSN